MLRLALIHACQHKAGRYAQAAARLRRVKFTALVQPDATKRNEAAIALGGVTAVESLADLLSKHSAEFDAVALHGSVAKRAELACQIAAAGKHLFVSTPLAVNATEVDRIAAACKSHGVTLCVGSHVRSRPSVATVKSAIASGKLGAPGLLRVHCWEPKGDAAGLQRHLGEFLSRIVQQLDLALWIFPQPPTEIYAVGRDQAASGENWPDYLQIHLGFPQGGMALISLARSLPDGDEYHTVSVIASTGAAYADDHLQKHLLFRGKHPQALQQDEMVPAIVTQLREFQTAIAEKRDPTATAKSMNAALSLTDAAWTSLVERRPIRLAGGNT